MLFFFLILSFYGLREINFPLFYLRHACVRFHFVWSHSNIFQLLERINFVENIDGWMPVRPFILPYESWPEFGAHNLAATLEILGFNLITTCGGRINYEKQ